MYTVTAVTSGRGGPGAEFFRFPRAVSVWWGFPSESFILQPPTHTDSQNPQTMIDPAIYCFIYVYNYKLWYS